MFCDTCQKEFSRNGYFVHFSIYHPTIDFFPCGRCIRKFQTIQNLKKHVTKNHIEPQVGSTPNQSNPSNVENVLNSNSVTEHNIKIDNSDAQKSSDFIATDSDNLNSQEINYLKLITKFYNNQYIPRTYVYTIISDINKYNKIK